MEHWCNNADRGKTEVLERKKSCPSVTLYTTNPTLNCSASNAGIRNNPNLRSPKQVKTFFYPMFTDFRQSIVLLGRFPGFVHLSFW
jgi:hypothetical protein